jgi:hypothetical protein
LFRTEEIADPFGLVVTSDFSGKKDIRITA